MVLWAASVRDDGREATARRRRTPLMEIPSAHGRDSHPPSKKGIPNRTLPLGFIHLETEIVKRSDRVTGFVVLPKRWIVERSIAWLNRCRRLAKDWENLNRNALGFLKLASIRLMLRKLCNPS